MFEMLTFEAGGLLLSLNTALPVILQERRPETVPVEVDIITQWQPQPAVHRPWRGWGSPLEAVVGCQVKTVRTSRLKPATYSALDNRTESQ